MGSYAGLNIKNHELLSWKNTYDEWYFSKQDRVREITEEDDSKSFIGYRVDVRTLRRRLQLAGHDLRSAERDFNDTRMLWIEEMKESLQWHRENQEKKPEQFHVDMIEEITSELEVIQVHEFNDWLLALPLVLSKAKDNLEQGIYDQKVHIENEPLLSFMLSSLSGVYDDNQGFAGATFPCRYVETYAVVLLEISNDDDACELDITDLINGGWVDDFNDIAQVQAGDTQFHEHFKLSLDELSTLNASSENKVLQRMVFASVITAMEAYLSDTMKRHVLNRSAIKRRFVESHQSFKDKIARKDVFKFLDTLDKTLNDEIDKISFHNVDTIKDLYNDVLLCNFPEDKLSDLRPSVLKRHDIVHRNGKKTDGSVVAVSQDDVNSLIELVYGIIKHIDMQIIDGLLVDSE